MIEHAGKAVGGMLSATGFSIFASAPHPADLTQVAGLITSVSGLLATLGAIWIGSRRRPAGSNEEREELLLELLRKQVTDEPHVNTVEPPDPPRRRRRRDRET